MPISWALDDLLQVVTDRPAVFATQLVLSFLGYLLCMRYIPVARMVLFERGLFGIDINKNSLEARRKFGLLRETGGNSAATREELKKHAVPESLGILVGAIYLSIVTLCLVLFGSVAASSSPSVLPLAKANAAINSIAVMLLLGFVDDVLDVRWRYKIVLSIMGVVPLLLAYDGPLDIVVPDVMRPSVGAALVHLGPLYLVYMGLFCVFCTNSINILAGVNGVEVGQSIVIAIASIAHNLIQLQHPEQQPQHLLCLTLLLPFTFVSIALFAFNKYPSRVFVGDSYTYFAGMTLAVAGITGAYTKTLFLFFTPQLINFVLSLPQLFGIVECPRHRVPTWDSKRNVLTNSRNYTILNALLMIFGDMHERTLTNVVIAFQIVCCLATFFIRYYCAGWFFSDVN